MTLILVTGSRNFSQDARGYLNFLTQALPQYFIPSDISQNISVAPTLIHGGARGADTAFGQAAAERGWTVQSYPADWSKYGRAAGPLRNTDLVNQDPDLAIVVLAKDSVGTKDCYNKLLKHKGKLKHILLITETEVKILEVPKSP